MSKSISIIGCGWFGIPLAKALISLGYSVTGTTTSPDKLDSLERKGIDSYQLNILEDHIEGAIESVLNQSEILVLNIPPGLRKNPNSSYVKKINQLLPYIESSSIKQVILVSSTSVFKDEFPFPRITNTTQPNGTSNTAKQLINVEEMLRSTKSFATTIVRFSGLIGNDRHPAKMLSGRTGIKNPKAPINLIHLDDCVNCVVSILKRGDFNSTYNVSYPYHPERKQYYEEKCKTLQLEAPVFNEDTISIGKIVDSTDTEKKLEYKFCVRI